MSYKPIPKKVLIHEVIYTEVDDNGGGWGGGSDNKPQEIKHVRFKPKNAVKKTSQDEEKLVKGVLFLDAKYSKPFIPFVVQSTVEFNGNDLTVLSCEPVFTTGTTPHHYEIELI